MITPKNYSPIEPLFQKFISETKRGKRLQKNGKMIARSSVQNYEALLFNIRKFTETTGEPFLINVKYRYSKRNFQREKRYYRKFYKEFTDFLYAKDCTDNYVGMLIKTLRSFFIYLNTAKGYETGGFYREFYANREETSVLVLSRDQLQFLILNKDFDSRLPPHLRNSKDVFVFGCTVGLRFSDLMALRNKHMERANGNTYICTKSRKTNTYTRIKLPLYALDILKRYKGLQPTLLPNLSLNQFNCNLKEIAFMAGWTQEIGKERSRRGKRREVKKQNGKTYRFCDLVSSHVMRRTAITTLLIHGMPEPLVRKISGHAANSKEFFKYVKYSETFMDHATDTAFERLLG